MIALYLTGGPEVASYGEGAWGEFHWGAADTPFYLPPALVLDSEDQRLRIETHDRAFSDGSVSAGDELRSREVRISGRFWSETRAQQQQLLAELRSRCAKPDQRLHVYSDAFLRVSRMDGFRADPEPLTDRVMHQVSVTWQCDDPFWYSTSTEVRTYDLAGDSLIKINLGPSSGLRPNQRGSHPVIRVTAGMLPLGSFSLRNATDQHLQFRYSDPELGPGKTAVIDCFEGRCYRGAVNTNRYMEGEFIRLLSAENWLYYSGGPCTLRLEWRPRWL